MRGIALSILALAFVIPANKPVSDLGAALNEIAALTLLLCALLCIIFGK
jgi:hypothetical protein